MLAIKVMWYVLVGLVACPRHLWEYVGFRLYAGAVWRKYKGRQIAHKYEKVARALMGWFD